MPLERRTRATFRRAELGFLGVWVNTRVHTPRRCGAPLRAGVLALVGLDCRPLRTSCWMVGTQTSRAMKDFGLPMAPRALRARSAGGQLYGDPRVSGKRRPIEVHIEG